MGIHAPRRGVLILTFSSVLGCSLGWAQPGAERLDLLKRVFIASQIYAAVQAYFAHTEAVPFAEIESAYRRYTKELVSAADRREFDLATMRFVAALKNGHTQFRDQWLDTT